MSSPRIKVYAPRVQWLNSNDDAMQEAWRSEQHKHGAFIIQCDASYQGDIPAHRNANMCGLIDKDIQIQRMIDDHKGYMAQQLYSKEPVSIKQEYPTSSL